MSYQQKIQKKNQKNKSKREKGQHLMTYKEKQLTFNSENLSTNMK